MLTRTAIIPATTAENGRGRDEPDDATMSIAIGLLLAAGLVHASITPAHLAEWWGYGALFATCAVAQLALGVSLAVRPGSGVLRAAIAVGVIAVAGWTLSRTVGLPLAPGGRVVERAGPLDFLTTLAEAITVALLVGRLDGRALAAARRTGAVLIGVLAVAFAAGLGHA